MLLQIVLGQNDSYLESVIIRLGKMILPSHTKSVKGKTEREGNRRDCFLVANATKNS